MTSKLRGSGGPAAVEAVRAVIARIPAGNVSTYGEVGKAASAGPRYVGWVLREHGADLPWWRVVRADGASHAIERAREHWDAEGIAYTGARADLRRCGLDAADLGRWETAPGGGVG